MTMAGGIQGNGTGDSRTTAEVIEEHGLGVHPEGGWFRETFRAASGGDRASSTSILFLLGDGQRSHWHRVDADEHWLFHAGAPLELLIADEEGVVTPYVIGGGSGLNPQAVVPAGAWQAAGSLGEWTLVGCVVAPGFEFSGFELAEPDWTPGLQD